MRASKQLKLVKQEMNDLLRKSGINWQEFQAMMPLIITEEEARLSQDGNQMTSMLLHGASSVPHVHILYTLQV